ALMTTVTDGTAAAAGATGACAVSGTTAAASALRAAAGRTLLVMTTSEETTKEWRLGKLCTSREVGGGGYTDTRGRPGGTSASKQGRYRGLCGSPGPSRGTVAPTPDFASAMPRLPRGPLC